MWAPTLLVILMILSRCEQLVPNGGSHIADHVNDASATRAPCPRTLSGMRWASSTDQHARIGHRLSYVGTGTVRTQPGASRTNHLVVALPPTRRIGCLSHPGHARPSPRRPRFASRSLGRGWALRAQRSPREPRRITRARSRYSAFD